jgi:hypothetical protein
MKKEKIVTKSMKSHSATAPTALNRDQPNPGATPAKAIKDGADDCSAEPQKRG